MTLRRSCFTGGMGNPSRDDIMTEWPVSYRKGAKAFNAPGARLAAVTRLDDRRIRHLLRRLLSDKRNAKSQTFDDLLQQPYFTSEFQRLLRRAPHGTYLGTSRVPKTRGTLKRPGLEPEGLRLPDLRLLPQVLFLPLLDRTNPIDGSQEWSMGAPFHGATPVRWCNDLDPASMVVTPLDIKLCADRGFVPDSYPSTHPLSATVPDGDYMHYEAVNPNPPVPPPSGSYDAIMQSTFRNLTGSDIPGALSPKKRFVPHEKPFANPWIQPLASRAGIVSEAQRTLPLRRRTTAAKSRAQRGMAERTVGHYASPSRLRHLGAKSVFALVVWPGGPPIKTVREGLRWRSPKPREKKGQAVSQEWWDLARDAFFVTEALEMLQAFHGALPEKCQTGFSPQAMASDILKCWPQVDLSQFVKNVVFDQLQDAFFGNIAAGAGNVFADGGSIRGKSGIAF